LKGDDPLIPVIGTIVNRLRKAIAIVEDGDTASQTIAKGKYIVWKGELCQTDSAITQGGTFATSGAGKNLTAKTEGLGGEIATLNSKLTMVREEVNVQWDNTKNGILTQYTPPDSIHTKIISVVRKSVISSSCPVVAIPIDYSGTPYIEYSNLSYENAAYSGVWYIVWGYVN